MAKHSDASAPERAYQALRDDLLAGRLRFRQRLDINAIADALAMSPTPVREALIRMRVERLIAFRPSHGFIVPLWSAAGLKALYRWRGDIAELAARSTGGAGGELTTGGDYTARVAGVLSAFNSKANVELAAASANADDRLSRARSAEAALWPTAGDEIESLALTIKSADLRRIVRGLRRYHDKRVALSGDIRDRAALMDLPENGG